MEECTIEWYERSTSFYRMNQTEDFRIDPADQQSDWGNCAYFFLRKENLILYKDIDHPYPMEFQNLKNYHISNVLIDALPVKEIMIRKCPQSFEKLRNSPVKINLLQCPL